MSKTRELVLGGDGLIGSALIAELQNRGHETISLDLKTGCDLRYVEDELFLNCDRVWFLAWDTGGAKYIEATDSQHQQYKHNCELSARVFDILARTGKPFLFISSQLAGLPTAYGATKFMAATWALQLGGKVARLWNVYGWERPTIKSHVITDLVLSGLQGRVRCMTDGLERRRFLYKSDCVDALIRLFDGPNQSAEIAAAEWITIREVGEAIACQLHVEAQFGTIKGSECLVDPQQVLPNWEPRISLEEGIARVISDAREYLAKDSTAAAAGLS